MTSVQVEPGVIVKTERVKCMDIVCDNLPVCGGKVEDKGAGTPTETELRVKGWHIYHGTTIGGASHDAVLCPSCASNRRRTLAPAPDLQPGQQELWTIEVTVDEASDQEPR